VPGSLTDADFDTVGQTIRHAAGAVSGLQDILSRLEESIRAAIDHRQIEAELGGLFVRAQAFVDQAIADAEARARRLIADAEIEAAQIVGSARDEAARLVAAADDTSALPNDAARRLQMTVESFGHVNSELLDELTALSEVLLATGPTPAAGAPMETPYEHGRHAHGTQGIGDVGGVPQDDQEPMVARPASTGYWSTLRPPRNVHVQKKRRGTTPPPASW